MPRYDFCCEMGHVTEMRAGLEVTALACPICGRDARRLAVYESQYINGETVAKGVTKASRMGNVVDRHGRYRVSLFQEASQEIDHAHSKAENEIGHELPSPPLWEEAKKRARKITQAT